MTGLNMTCHTDKETAEVFENEEENDELGITVYFTAL